MFRDKQYRVEVSSGTGPVLLGREKEAFIQKGEEDRPFPPSRRLSHSLSH